MGGATLQGPAHRCPPGRPGARGGPVPRGALLLRIDFNIDPLPFWEFLNAQDPDRVGIAEIRYVEGLYRMWDDLLANTPLRFIDNCASGGRRIDLEAPSLVQRRRRCFLRALAKSIDRKGYTTGSDSTKPTITTSDTMITMRMLFTELVVRYSRNLGDILRFRGHATRQVCVPQRLQPSESLASRPGWSFRLGQWL